MRRRSTVLVAVAVALLGLAVGVVLDQVDDGDEAASAPADDACTSTPPLVAVAGTVPDRPGRAQVTVIRPDGSRAVASRDWVATDPTVSPDGQRLAVTRADGDHESSGPASESIWTVGLDGSEPVQLTDGPVLDTAAAWSPDGATIAFVRSTATDRRVMAVPATGGEPRELMPSEGLDPIADLAWSPDGARLAFVRVTTAEGGRTEGAALWTVAADGSGPARVADLDSPATSLDWHPDGSQILVGLTSDGTDGDLALVDLATGVSTVVAHDAALGRWSRRGTSIVHYTRTGVTREASWRLVESPFAGGALGDARDLGVTDLLRPQVGLAVARCR